MAKIAYIFLSIFKEGSKAIFFVFSLYEIVFGPKMLLCLASLHIITIMGSSCYWVSFAQPALLSISLKYPTVCLLAVVLIMEHIAGSHSIYT